MGLTCENRFCPTVSKEELVLNQSQNCGITTPRINVLIRVANDLLVLNLDGRDDVPLKFSVKVKISRYKVLVQKGNITTMPKSKSFPLFKSLE